jgi:hypothetical protein
MAFGDQIAKMAKRYSAVAEVIPLVLRITQEQGARVAIQVAAEATAPIQGEVYGEGMVSGSMQAAWEKDSIPVPVENGYSLTSTLANNQEYSSFVNDGHRLDQHYVPGLIIDPVTGLLTRVDPSLGGIVVGKSNAYIPGRHMVQKAVDAYERFMAIAIREKILRPLEIGENPLRTMARRVDQSFNNDERFIGGNSASYGRTITPENEAWIHGALPGQHTGEW